MKLNNIPKAILVILAAALIVGIATAGTEVYRLERNTETEELAIVGVDGVRRSVCLASPEDYAMMTGRVDRVWRALNSTEDGRRKLHGPSREQIIDDQEKKKITIYEDGFCHTEKMEIRTRNPFVAKVDTNKTNRAIMSKPANISDRQWAMRKAVLEAKKRRGRTVTVEHDAATGKDTVK